MAKVRQELGLDALILGTRRVADGVELTAALEPGSGLAEAPALRPSPSQDGGRSAALRWHGVPATLAMRLQAGCLSAALASALTFRPLNLRHGAAPVLLAGPPGAGKTLTAARLATRLVLAGTAPLVITADGRRAGATEQLAAFTRLLGLTLTVANQPAPLLKALARREGDAPVLIDGAGLDPFDPPQRDELLELAAAASATVILVLPAGLDPVEATELAHAFAGLGAKALVGTRLDLARRIGGLLAASTAGLALAEAGIGPGAADGLTPFTPAFVASRLVLPAPAAPRMENA